MHPPITGSPRTERTVPVARREFLRVGALTGLGVTLPQLLAQEASGTAARADSCIIIFLNGGPSHLDMWDMKPDAPREVRGPFAAIPTSVPGLRLCEHLPRLAQQMHRCTLVRSMNHSVSNSHAAAVYVALTGHDRGEKGGGAKPDDHPNIGSVLSRLRPGPATSFPYVALPYKTQEGAGGPLQPGFQAGLLGPSLDPFWVLEDANDAAFRVNNLSLNPDTPLPRMQARDALLERLDRAADVERHGSLLYDEMTTIQRRAFDMLTSETTQRAFEISRETDAVRERYGRNIYGQSILLARRLIEAGTRVVTMSWAPHANATWDTHGQNFERLQGGLLPQFDAAASSLLSDLAESGRLDRTIVAILGDFGRSPNVNANAGRDHWGACYSILLAGGGFRGGFVHGASDRIGALPAESPTSPANIIATLYHLLGVDPNRNIHDMLDRPHPLVPNGVVVRELIG